MSALLRSLPVRFSAFCVGLLLVTRAGAAGAEEQVPDPVAAIMANSFAPHAVSAIVGRSSHPPGGPRRPGATRPTPPGRDAATARRATEPYGELVDRYSTEHRLDANLVKALIQAESGGDRFAVSRKGAKGLMQLMPATAAELGPGDLFDPEHNIASGTRYLRSLLDRYHSVELALWAYNAGPQAVEQGRMPAETRQYVPRVLRLRRQLVGRGER
ncbi:MAG: lytic transglycosylase domain-containing protein [Candidatus Latescibacterota bacterium]